MSSHALRIGIVGTGNMGGAMAHRLLEAGHEVAVRDVVAARESELAAAGAAVLATPRAIAEGGELVIVAVVDAAQCEAVLFGDGSPDGRDALVTATNRPTVVLCPTIGPGEASALAARLDAAGFPCIEAPMSGGPARARDGSMSLMVAAADALFERHRALLETLSSRLHRVGNRIGDGARTKLVNNLLAAINLAGAAEAIALAERVGLDARRTLAVIEASSGQSWIGSDRMRRALDGDWAPRAHTTLLAKDSRLALAMARDAGFEAPIGRAAAARFAEACAAGFADLDDASLLLALRALDA